VGAGLSIPVFVTVREPAGRDAKNCLTVLGSLLGNITRGLKFCIGVFTPGALTIAISLRGFVEPGGRGFPEPKFLNA
jgi:hypothetical protein